MRFEAKHSYFKTLSKTSGNFKNLPKTLSKRHELWFIEHLMKSQNKLLNFEVTLSKPVNTRRGNNIPDLKLHRWAQVNSFKLHTKQSVLLCPIVGSSVAFKFGLLDNIVSGPTILFCCKMLVTVKYEERYEAFAVVFDEDYLIFNLSSLERFKAFSLHTLGGRSYIAVKENLKCDLLGTDHMS